MDDLFRAVRQRTTSATWSRGVELSRTDAVVGVRERDGEIELQITVPGAALAVAVYLYPDDEDWSCDCNDTADVCIHVAGAVIALRKARAEGRDLPGPSGSAAPGRLGYRLTRERRRLALRRVVVRDDGEEPFESTLAACAAGRGPTIVATQQDAQMEALWASTGDGPIASAILAQVLGLLRDLEDVRFEGRPVTIGEPTTGLRARVEDCATGYRVRLEQHSEVEELFENGAVRARGAVRALLDPGFNDRELAELKRGRVYEAKDVGTLVGTDLPRLEARVPLVIDAAALPGRTSAKPRLQVHAERRGDELEVLAHVVYGDPPLARLDGEQLVRLRGEVVPVRDTRREERLLRLMSRELHLEPGIRARMPAAEAIEFVARAREVAPGSLTGAGAEAFYESSPLQPHLEVNQRGDYELWFEPAETQESAQGRARAGGRADPAAVLAAWERGDALAPLLEGGFGRIPVAWLERLGHRVRALLDAREVDAGAAKSGAGGAPWALADLAALCADLNEAPPPSLDRLRAVLSDEAVPGTELPADLTAELRDYQRDGAAWLGALREAGMGALLADDMGLGKTLQALCGVRGRTLVVCPTSVLHNWRTEAARFRPGLSTHIYHGPSRALDAEADLTVTTYALLRLDVERLAEVRWGSVVLDEAQMIKNPTSQVARAAHRLEADFRVALTGTPVENRLEDLWSQMHFLNRGLLGGRQDFHDRWVVPITGGDASAGAALRERLRPFVLRRLKSEVARELPPRTDVVLTCELAEAERDAYDAVRAATRNEILAKLDGGAGTLAVLEALLRLRQAACHAALVPGHEDRAADASSKIELLLETLDTAVAEGHKALVFSQWTSLLDLVEPHLRSADIGFTRIDGSTRDRAGVVESFQSERGPPVLLISLKAGGTGLNLTAADHVFLLDPWWNPAVEEQAADRAHRIGQTKPVLVHRLVALDTVEERILALQERKRDLARAAVGEGAGGAAVTREELLALIG